MIWNEDKYTVKQGIPSRQQFNEYYVYKEGECVLNCSFDEVLEKGNDYLIQQGIIKHKCDFVPSMLSIFANNRYIVEVIEDKEGKYKEATTAYYEERSKLQELYLSKLYRINGVSKEIGDVISHYIQAITGEYCNEAFEEHFNDWVCVFGVYFNLDKGV